MVAVELLPEAPDILTEWQDAICRPHAGTSSPAELLGWERQRSNEVKSVVVVGAGIGGLCAALELSRRGYRVTVVDGQSQVGGLLRSERIDDLDFDLGTHFIIETQVPAIDSEIISPFVRSHDPWVFQRSLDEGHLINGVFNTHTGCPDARTLVPHDQVRTLQDEYLAAAGAPPEFCDARSWAVDCFGPTIADSLYGPALLKLTGVPPDELDSSAIHSLHLSRVVLFDSEASIRMKSEPAHDARLAYAKTHDGTSTVRKYYPRQGGVGAWPAYLKSRAESREVEFRLGRAVEGFRIADGKIIAVELEDGEAIGCEMVVWTVQPEILLRAAKKESFGSPPVFRDVQIYHFRIDGRYQTSLHWITNYDSSFASYRTTLYDNFAPAGGSTYKRLTVEVLADPGSGPIHEQRLTKELCESQLIADPDQVSLLGSTILPRALPVPRVGGIRAREATVRKARKLAKNLWLAGAGSGAHGQVAVLKDAFEVVASLSPPSLEA